MRDDNRGSNGSRPHGMRAAGHLTDVSEPIDLVAVQADDELINALAAGMTVTAPGRRGYDADDHVAAILAAWRAEVDEEPIPELVDIDTAMAAIQRGMRPRSRVRHLAPVAAAAAFVVLAIGGVSLGSADAQPGDALWSVSKVLYSQRAESVEAAARIETRIDNAKQALLQGHSDQAAQDLMAAAADLSKVRPEEGKAELTEVQSFLAAKAAETPIGDKTDPATPLRKNPAVKVPKGAAVGKTPSPTKADPSTTADLPGTSAETPDPGAGAGSGPGPEAGTSPLSPSPSPTTPADAPPPATVEGTSVSPTPTPTATSEGGPASPAPTPTSMGSSEDTRSGTTPPTSTPS